MNVPDSKFSKNLFCKIKSRLHYLLGIYCPKVLSQFIYFRDFKKFINFRNPRSLNEKINWLLFNTDTSEWSRLSDKYCVRKYVIESGLSDILVPLYGDYDNVDDINFDSLPNSFVLKANNGSGTVIIVKDKSTIDINRIKEELRMWLQKPYGILTAEPHYLRIKPRILVEKYLQQDQVIETTSVIDYKIFCFNGKPHNIWVCYNRSHDFVCVAAYDLNWERHNEHSLYTPYYRYSELDVPKPQNLESMLNAAKILSKGFPQVRVDFYIIDNKLFFGEMTFTAAAGRMNFFTNKFLLEMGDLVPLF